MEKISLREYAKRKKLSYFAVMKMVRNGDVKSETVVENGKEVPYVLYDEVEESTKKVVEKETPEMSLEEENALLKQEIIKLQEALARCNKRTALV